MDAAWFRRRIVPAAVSLLALCTVSLVHGRAPSDPPRGGDAEGTLIKAAQRVEDYFTRAQSLVCTETVHDQPLSYGLTADGFGRTIESELRLSWEAGADGAPATEALTRRQVLRVNGRPPKAKDRNNCTTAEQHESEPHPLSFLMANSRGDYTFTWAGHGRIDKRQALLIDFREKAPLKVQDVRQTADNEDCISYNLTGGMYGRIWVDAESYDVLRLDQRLGGQVEIPLPPKIARRAGAPSSWTVERHDVTMRFKRVTFDEPAEALVLPVSSVRLQVTRGAMRKRTTTTYTAYKRFLTGGRIVPSGGGQH
jgi:hypothetical protein